MEKRGGNVKGMVKCKGRLVIVSVKVKEHDFSATAPLKQCLDCGWQGRTNNAHCETYVRKPPVIHHT